MDNHPIPQDITGFQFRLIGNMTVKQFLYLASGTVVAWLFFFVLPLPALIRWPISLISIGFGGAIAFIPIDGRPMDQMFVNLIKAILAPTQFVYDKTGGIIPAIQTPIIPHVQTQPQTQQTNQQLGKQQATTNVMPTQTVMPQSPPPPVSQAEFSMPTIVLPQPSPTPAPAPITTQTTSLGWQIDEDDKKDNKKYIEENNNLIKNEQKLEGEVEELKKELSEAKAEEQATTGVDSSTHQKTEELSKMLEQTIAQKAELERELAILKTNLENTPKQQTFTPSTATPLPQTQHVRQVPKGLEKASGVIASPEEPNLIVGIVKDPRGNPLQNILVEVKDLEDNPVRAFKTNALGQFASATSLSNGKYVITFEDTRGQNRFDSVQIEANGGILLPLEIFSIDQREELRRELFN